MSTTRACNGKTKKGTPCKATPLKAGSVIDDVTVKGKHCRAHDPDLPDSARFGSRAQAKEAAKLGGRPALPKPTDVARRLIEENVHRILRPHFRTLGLDINDAGEVEVLSKGAVIFGESKDGDIVRSSYEDLGAQIAAAEKLLDRVYGRPKQQTELTGAQGGPIEMVPVARERGAEVVRILTGTGAIPVPVPSGNGNGHQN